MSSRWTETKHVCGACGKSAGCDSWLACEICEGWFHASCVKINEDQYKVMQELATCHWFCQLCDTKLGKIIPTIVRLSDRVTEVDNKCGKRDQCLLWKSGESYRGRKQKSQWCWYSHVVKIERDMKVMTEHMTKMKEDMTKDLQKLATDVSKV